MTSGWAYGKEAADGRVPDPAAAYYPVVVRARLLRQGRFADEIMESYPGKA
jgi:hypothetical protein